MINNLPSINNKIKNPQDLYGAALIISSIDQNLCYNHSISEMYSLIISSIETQNFTLEYTIYNQPHKLTVFDNNQDIVFIAKPFTDKKFAHQNISFDIDEYEFYRYFYSTYKLLHVSPYYQNIKCEYFEREIIPALWHQQIVVYFDCNDKPWAFFTWANISSVVEKRILRDKNGLKWNDWNSGERLFVNDLVSPYGKVSVVIRDMRKRVFANRRYARGIRRKVDDRIARKQNFTDNDHKVLIPDSIIKLLDDLSRMSLIDNKNSIKLCSETLSQLDQFISQHEIRYLLDQNCMDVERQYRSSLSLYDKCLQEIIGTLRKTNNQQLIQSLNRVCALRSFSNRSFEDINDVTINEIEYRLKNILDIKIETTKSTSRLYNEEPSHVISIIYKSVKHYFPEWLSHLELVINKIDFDFRLTIDKMDRPFTRTRGLSDRIYISVPYTKTHNSALYLVHEVFHALHFEMQKQHLSYLYFEIRPLITEVFAFFGELLYINYLQDINDPEYINFNKAHNYLSQEYNASYKKLINSISQQSTLDYSKLYKLTYQYSRIISEKLNSIDRSKARKIIREIITNGMNFETKILLDEISNI